MNDEAIQELRDLKRQVELAISVLECQPFVYDYSACPRHDHYDFSVGDFFIYRHSNRGHIYEVIGSVPSRLS